MRSVHVSCHLYLACLLAVGCGESKPGVPTGPGGPTGSGESQTAMISAAGGGMISVDGTTLSVPPGALPADTQITMTSTTDTPPAAYAAWYSPVFRFEPDGLVFRMPVQVSFELAGSPTNPVVMWSLPAGGFENRAGAVSGAIITTQVTHFSEGFAAPAPVDGVDAGVPADSAPPRPDGSVGTCNHNGVCDSGEGAACADCTPPDDAGLPLPDGSIGTCNHNAVCDSGEDENCPDCSVPIDGGVVLPDGGGGSCNHNAVCDPGEDPACPDCAHGGCNFNAVCDAGEDPACPDCGIPTDGGVPLPDGNVPLPDGASGTCDHDAVCDPGEDPACPDCAHGGCNFNALCDPGEDPACPDCGAPSDGGVGLPDGGGGSCNDNAVCDPGEDPACPDCAHGGCNFNALCDPGEDPGCPDCGAPSDGGVPLPDGNVPLPDGASGTCDHDALCDPGEDPACPDCVRGGCNFNAVCDPGEDPGCPDCGAPSDGGVPLPDGSVPLPDGASGTCNHDAVCDPGEDPACADCLGGIQAGPGFHLLGAYGAGGSEAVREIDPVTGASTAVGSFGGLFGWGGQFRVAADNAHAYALGDDSSFSPRLWTLDLATGSSTSIAVSPGLWLGGVTDLGQVIVAWWDGTTERVSRLDPQTGASTAIGTLAGLWGWSGQMAFDRSRNTLYAIGQPSMMSSDSNLYVLDVATGTSSSVPTSHAYTLGGVTADGMVIASYWNGSSQRVVAIDPGTGGATDLGALGLVSWYGSLTYDAGAHTAYAFGYPSVQSSTVSLYWLDMRSGIAGSIPVGQQFYAGRY